MRIVERIQGRTSSQISCEPAKLRVDKPAANGGCRLWFTTMTPRRAAHSQISGGCSLLAVRGVRRRLGQRSRWRRVAAGVGGVQDLGRAQQIGIAALGGLA